MSLSKDLLFAPGVARPDSSGCWNEGFTFEHCCVPWDRDQVGIGNSDCWTHGYNYKVCCEPTDKPRKSFSCEEAGDDWLMFRRDMMLGKSLHDSNIKSIQERSVDECLLGHFIASLVHLALASRSVERLFVAAYERAAMMVRVVLRSPVSIAEVFASGWPVGPVFSTLQGIPRVRDYAHSLVKDIVFQPSRPEGIRAREAIVLALSRGQRVKSDYTLPLLTSSLSASSRGTYQDCLDVVITSWGAALSLRNFDGPRAPREEWKQISSEVSGLLSLGMRSLKKAIIGHDPIDTASPKFDIGILDGDPLAVFLSMHQPLLELMSAFQYDPVVTVDPASVTHETIYFPGLRRELQPHGVPLMELHVLPQYDAVSNSIRTSGQPFCYDRAFLSIVALLACKGNCQTDQSETSYCCDAGTMSSHGVLRFWEVGANLGDCTLWANTVLHHGYSGIRSQSIAFEPMPNSAEAFRRSAAALLKKNLALQQASNKIPEYSFLPEISVHEVALAANAGTLNLRIPPDSIAESTFHDCSNRHGNVTDCKEVIVQTETVDRLLQLHTGTVDLLKLHVQGSEVEVLKGARQSLLSGKICVLTLMLSAVALSAERAFVMGRELYDSLSGYFLILVDMDGIGSQFPVSAKMLGRIIAGARKHWDYPDASFWDSKGRKQHHPVDRYLVAVNEDSRCSKSPAVVTAQLLWGKA